MATSTSGRMSTPEPQQSSSWLGESEMARRVRRFDWSATPLGPLGAWPQSLRNAVASCLHSKFQMAIYWGPELNCLYNDAERDVLGQLHPGALGLPARELLRDSWEVVGPQLEAVMRGEGATWAEDQPLTFDRHGIPEVGYFTYSYSPILEDEGAVGGVLLVSQDTTARVLAERRLDVLRELATRSIDARTGQEACELAALALAGADLAFTLIYLIDEGGKSATCAATTGMSDQRQPSQLRVDLEQFAPGAGGVFDVLAAERPGGAVVDSALFIAPADDSPPSPRTVSVSTVKRSPTEPVAGFFVAGVSDRDITEASQRSFLELLTLGIGRSLASVRAREVERERARLDAEARGRKSERALREDELSALLEDLRAVQRRVATAADAERRRIESNLHDGAQQRLMAIRLEVGLLEELVERDPATARIELGRLQGELDLALTELRELAHGLYPPLLGSDGLRAALSAVALRAPIPVRIDGPAIRRMPRPIESTAYFACLEALQNAVKHAGEGASIAIRLELTDDVLMFSVGDDGVGFDVHAPSSGDGLTNLRDRLGAVGGSTEIRSAPGHGTTVLGRISLP